MTDEQAQEVIDLLKAILAELKPEEVDPVDVTNSIGWLRDNPYHAPITPPTPQETEEFRRRVDTWFPTMKRDDPLRPFKG